MKVYIADKYRIKDYTLPSKIEDSFLINYISSTGIEESITLVAEDNKWTINSNLDMHIIKGGIESNKEIITNNNFYQLKFSDLEDYISLYCFDTPVTFYRYSVENKTSISLGRDKNDIIYDNVNIGSPHFEIIKSNNCWILKDSGADELVTFVNGKRYHQIVLKMGDIIFTNGLKIIWMETFIKFNNPNNSVKTSLSQYKDFNMFGIENKYTPVKDTEKGIVLFNDNQLFFHTPRIKNSFTGLEIKLSPPPPPIKDDGPPAILTLGATIMMGLSSSITSIVSVFNIIKGNGSLFNAVIELSICLLMIISTMFFPLLLDKYQKRRIKKKEKNRQIRYGDYLNKKKAEIDTAIKKESEFLLSNYLDTNSLQQNIIQKTNKIWSREISDNDFLTFKLGMGNKKADIKVSASLEDFTMDDDNMRTQVESLLNTTFMLKNVPITASLVDNKILPLIISTDYQYKQQVIDAIMLQLIGYHSGMDLKLIIFTNDENTSKWEYLKYLPHCCNDDKSIHFFAKNEDEAKQISNYLEKIYQERINIINTNHKNDTDVNDSPFKDVKVAYKNFNTYYVIITDNYVASKDFGIIQNIVNSDANIGFSLLMIEPTMQNIPSKSEKFISINNTNCSISGKDLSATEQNIFIPEFFTSNITSYMQIIANIPVGSLNNKNTLPTSISFLEMYKVGKIEQLNIVNRWKNNDPTISLHTPLGVREDGKLFEIDLHEKFHGPHGLIAGATGSGKSEFIITFILSMAINYHPYEVQFVLIDYKGGGLAGAFENRETGIKIPHLVGTITNLDTGEMNRTLVSINSELKRRQKIFNEARDQMGESTVDIYKYQKYYREGKVKEPISHLFIISDEFAELKSQQPDFMNELVSAARIGRSLGVHLILATQKPSGVVDDQIWSNSRFKIALKVQTAEDSNELLKRSDAANIKETGRFYLQVGYDELFELGQSAWAGAKYIPTDRIVKNIDDSLDFIDDNGTIIKKVNDIVKNDNTINLGDQLTNIVKYLYDIAKRDNIAFNQLWLPSIPGELYLSNVINKYNYHEKPYIINPIIGEYDDPATQFQDILTVNLTTTGGVLIYGNVGSGKENLLMTLIYSICIAHTPNEVNFYILDFGSEVLKAFSNMPHVGDIALTDNEEKLRNCLLMLDRETRRRKELFSDYGGSYEEYIKSDQKKVPLIITVLNGYEAFVENYGDYDDFLSHIIRESSKYGIIFIMTTVATNSVKSRISQLFNNTILLQVKDDFDYQFVLGAPSGLKPSKLFGRGLSNIKDKVFEFQTALIYYKDKINDTIKVTSDNFTEKYTKNPPIPLVPENITADLLLPYIDNITNVPIGININDGSINKYNFIADKITPIIGNGITNDTNFITHFFKIMSSIPSIKLKVIDFTETVTDEMGVDYANGEFTDNIKNIKQTERESNSITIYIIVGIGYIYDRVLDEGIESLFSIFSNLKSFPNSYFILIDNYSSYRNIMKEKWYEIINNKSGIWIGKDVEVQKIIKINNMTNSDAKEDFKGVAYTITNSQYTLMKCIGTEKEGGYNY